MPISQYYMNTLFNELIQHSTEISTLKKELEEMTSLYYKTQDELMVSEDCAATITSGSLCSHCLQSAEYNEDQSDCKVKELQEEVGDFQVSKSAGKGCLLPEI